MFLIAALIGFVVMNYYLDRADAPSVEPAVTSYDECIEAGYAHIANDPPQCETPDGQVFTAEDDIAQTPDDPDEVAERTISIYLYDADQDLDAAGNIQCTAAGLVAVERTIPHTETPLQDAVRELLAGEIRDDEVEAGLSTEFPLSGLTFEGVTLDDDDVLVLHFDDPQMATSGGSCRVGILWSQIEATATQFPTVDDVRFAPEELFQP